MKNLSKAGDGDEPDSTYQEPIEEPLPSGCQHRLHPSTTPLKTYPRTSEALFFCSRHLNQALSSQHTAESRVEIQPYVSRLSILSHTVISHLLIFTSFDV